MDLEKFYIEHNINKYISLNEYNHLKKIKIKKGKEMYLSTCFFLVSGRLELFLINKEDVGIKIRELDSNDYLVGMSTTRDLKGVSVYYRAISECVLIEISSELLNRLLKNLKFLELYNELLFNTLIIISNDLIARSTLEKEKLIKYYLLKEVKEDNIVEIKNNHNFMRNYKINRSTFYSNIKKLEELGEIKKTNNGYKIIK